MLRSLAERQRNHPCPGRHHLNSDRSHTRLASENGTTRHSHNNLIRGSLPLTLRPRKRNRPPLPSHVAVRLLQGAPLSKCQRVRFPLGLPHEPTRKSQLLAPTFRHVERRLKAPETKRLGFAPTPARGMPLEIPRQARDDCRRPALSCRAQSRHLGAYPMARLQEQAQIPRPAFARGYGGQARLGMPPPMRAKSQLAVWPTRESLAYLTSRSNASSWCVSASCACPSQSK